MAYGDTSTEIGHAGISIGKVGVTVMVGERATWECAGRRAQSRRR